MVWVMTVASAVIHIACHMMNLQELRKKHFHGLMQSHMLEVAGSAVFLGEEGCARVELPSGAFRALG
jgi:hypothetical protein